MVGYYLYSYIYEVLLYWFHPQGDTWLTNVEQMTNVSLKVNQVAVIHHVRETLTVVSRHLKINVIFCILYFVLSSALYFIKCLALFFWISSLHLFCEKNLIKANVFVSRQNTIAHECHFCYVQLLSMTFWNSLIF